MIEAIIMLSILNLLLILAVRQRNRDNRNLERTLDRTEKQVSAGKSIAVDLGKRCTELEHQRNFYQDAYAASEKKRQELVERLQTMTEGKNDNV